LRIKIFLILILLFTYTNLSYAIDKYKLVRISNEKIYASSGSSVTKPIVVKLLNLDGTPASGQKIHFSFINHRKKAVLDTDEVITDINGVASAELQISNKIENNSELILSASNKDISDEPIYFYITIHSSGWIKFLFFSLFGGLAIFLYGMDVAKISLQKAAGRKMKHVLSKLTQNRFMGVLVGIFITSIVQSSSATTVLLVGFVSAGLMTFAQSMAVSMGAGIGTTITVQLIAFKLSDYALLLIFIGFLTKALSKEDKTAHIGSIIMGFGMVFFGIKIMSDTMQPLRDYQPIINFFASLKDPFYALLISTVFTAIIQSSAATIGILIALSTQGLLDLSTAIPMVFGANIGTTITAVLASIGSSANAKKTAYWHTLYKTIGVIIFYPFLIPFEHLIVTISGSGDLARQIANAHTIFNLIIMALILGFLRPLSRLMDKIVPEVENKGRFKTHYIRKSLLSSPSLALEQAYREILHMSNIVEKMVINIRPALMNNDYRIIQKNIEKDDKVDILEEEITPFLTAISRKELNEQESMRQRGMLFIVDNLEHIGDIITKDLMKLAQKTADNDLAFSEEGRKEIEEYCDKVLENYRLLLTSLRREDRELAKEIVSMKISLDKEARNYHLLHIKRLEKALPESVETSAVHLDVIDCLKNLNTRIVDIAQTIVEEI